MGSLDLDQSFERLGDSFRCLSLDARKDFSLVNSVKLVIEDFHSEGSQDDNASGSKPGDSLGALEGELILLKAAFALSNVNRRLSLGKLLDLQGNVRVFCRVRPYLPHENVAHACEVVSPTEVRVSSNGEPSKTFKFDKVFSPSASQEDVFLDVQPTIKSALDGHNICIFSYGQTGTGKTYTMEGQKGAPGIVPRTLQQLFKDKNLPTSDYRFTLSMLEIYKGTLRDLLVPRPTRLTDPPAKSLNIHLSVSDHVEVENLTEYVIDNLSDALKFYRKGTRARSTSSTSSNESSSRSHCLVRVNIVRKSQLDKVSRSKVWLIDLGGSERFFKTQAWGKVLEEGKSINVSLTALGDVISALQKKQAHIPYRNSKLTQILRDCLGCNSKVVMFVHASPKEEDSAETTCSLTFAARARGIHLSRDCAAKSREREARISSIVQKMEALEGECQRLSVDIQALESTVNEKKRNSTRFSDAHQLLESSDHRNDKLTGAATTNPSPSTPSLPRFMTPTISSLCKNRCALQEFNEPIWPESLLAKKIKSFASSDSPQISIDLGRKRAIVPASRQRIHHPQQQQQQVKNPALMTPNGQEEDSSTPTKAALASRSRSAAHVKWSKEEMEHQRSSRTKIQRRLTLECSSRLSVNF
ncbi:kinesin-like protein KIN-14U [Selaginella moellendorffii]|nr:kinesin-like protein KIN-14U [Selaginella moellendorffii]|eukprot:XP_002964543.2 kinesin-like protein KIN-14U [Selaginella moellendorffii]